MKELTSQRLTGVQVTTRRVLRVRFLENKQSMLQWPQLICPVRAPRYDRKHAPRKAVRSLRHMKTG